jgi:hypothetical protein
MEYLCVRQVNDPPAIDDDGLAGEIGITNGVEVTLRGIVWDAGPRGKEIGGRFCLQLGFSFVVSLILPELSGRPVGWRRRNRYPWWNRK